MFGLQQPFTPQMQRHSPQQDFDKKVVSISWLIVQQKFFKKYDDLFLQGDAKAYLDSCGKVIGKFTPCRFLNMSHFHFL